VNNKSEVPCWYALSTKPRHEKAVAQFLGIQKMESFLPLYLTRRVWSDRQKAVEAPLFSGYVFCRFGYRERLRVLNTPGVGSIVGFAGQDTPVDEVEIDVVRRILASGRPLEPWPYLRTGDRVRIDAGVLAGIEGTLVREKGLTRVVVNVELLKRSVSVETDRDLVSPVSTPKAAAGAGMSLVH
jgi:transcription antitermination factor NusG